MIKIPGFKGSLAQNIPLAPLTTWRIGGNARYFAVPSNVDDIISIIRFCYEENIPLFVLGHGSNVLINDDGLSGITITLGKAFDYSIFNENSIDVGSGSFMPKLSKQLALEGYSGFEHMIGIPGTVGAGVIINAGKGRELDMKDILLTVTYLNSQCEIITDDVDILQLDYRSSILRSKKVIVIEARFNIQKRANPAEIRQRSREILIERRKKFPLLMPNAGSVFKSPSVGPTAGYLIEQAGLKGRRVGQAEVSRIHSNFIVNLGKATSDDVKQLIEIIQNKVSKIYGVDLEREIIYLPDESSWLL